MSSAQLYFALKQRRSLLAARRPINIKTGSRPKNSNNNNNNNDNDNNDNNAKRNRTHVMTRCLKVGVTSTKFCTPESFVCPFVCVFCLRFCFLFLFLSGARWGMGVGM